ncbi:MAG: adenylate/guanylate cyclase domain-containing protein [Myxococcales bacterium]
MTLPHERPRLAPLTLAFGDPELEQGFQLATARQLRRRHPIGWGITALIWLGMAATDPLIAGSRANLAVIHGIRFAVFPLLLAVAAVAWLRLEQFVRWRHVSVAAGLMAGVWSSVAMVALVPEPEKLAILGSSVGFAVAIVAVSLVWSSRLLVTLTIVGPVLVASTLLTSRYPDPSNVATLLWIYVAAAVGTFGSWRFEVNQRFSFLLARSLDEERARSDALLHNLLPPAVASRLKAGGGRIAEYFPSATILFCDIVGFTGLSERVPAGALVATLDELFSSFDALADRFGLEKIKTIGDAYMAVAGVPQPRPDHARQAVEMALAMREAVAAHAFPGGERLRIRIGIHTGPVVAGVIGKKKLVYDLWGDAVNTASRLESHGLPGAIHVSEATAAALDEQFELEPRGPVELKGKAPMRTFLVSGPRRAAKG